jgi:hypothetical protein
MQRPAGRTILTGLAWSAGLVPWSTADGMIRLHPSGQQRVVDSLLAIIPEPERPRRRPHTCDDYRVKVPVEPSGWPCRGCDQGRDMARYHRASLRYPGGPTRSRAETHAANLSTGLPGESSRIAD